MSNKSKFPVLPLRDVIVFPNMVIPLFVGRSKSIAALDAAMEDNKQIFLVAQKNADNDNPSQKDVYKNGTLSTILQLLKLPDGTIKVLVEGSQRATIDGDIIDDNYLQASVKIHEELDFDETEVEALSRSAVDLFDPVSYTHLPSPRD